MCKLKCVREEKGYSRNALAKISGVSDVMIGYLETNKRIGSDMTWKKLADALDVEVNEIREEELHPIEILVKDLVLQGYVDENNKLNDTARDIIINEIEKYRVLNKK